MPGQVDVKKHLSATVESGLRKRLKIKPADQLPTALKSIISKTATDVEKVITERYVKKEALRAGRTLMKDASITQAVDSRLKNALKGVQMVSQSTDLQKMIDENAKMLFQKYTALVNVTFTTDQAFQLILAEVTAKKSR